MRRDAYRRSLEQKMKSRKVVTRSGRGFRGYFPSKKLNRMMEYESLLERDAMYLFEHSPGVKYFQEQPELIMYEYENKIRKYYPDFAVTLNSGALIHIEIKPQIKLDSPVLSSKFEAIISRYVIHPADFIILTEKTIRQEPLFSNLKIINNVKKFHLDITESFIKARQLLLTNKQYTLMELIGVIGKTEVLIMLAHHKIVCDLNQSLWSPTNYVRLPKEDDDETVLF